MSLDFGQRVRGVILDNEWRTKTPRRVVSGVVYQLYPKAPNIAGIHVDGAPIEADLVQVRVGR